MGKKRVPPLLRTFESPHPQSFQLSFLPPEGLGEAMAHFEPDGTPNPPNSPVSIIGDDIEKMPEVIDSSQAENTRRNYDRAWGAFECWCGYWSLTALPADTKTICDYLVDCSERGFRISTIRAARAAIGDRHWRSHGIDPTATPEVKAALSSLAQGDTRPQVQARPLTNEALDKVRATACNPRQTWGTSRRQESPESAERRGRMDIAMLSLLRDSLLGVSELAELRWRDIKLLADGSGSINVRKWKAEQGGADQVISISQAAVKDLQYIRPEGETIDSETKVIGLTACQIGRRVRKAAQIAGLGDGYSGHSGRVGMALDLAASGTDRQAIMTAGRWKSKRMPDLYIGSQAVDQGT